MRSYLAPLFALFVVACDDGNSKSIQTPAVENEARSEPLEFALSRTKETTLQDGDPKSADAFWEERDKEISLVLDYVETGEFGTPADKLQAMVSIDQSLRHLSTALEQNSSHFDSEEEFELVKRGFPERVMRVDAFNTAQLKEMLQGRGWFRDDIDGALAAQYAWVIAQHADRDPAFQREVLAMMEAELGAPGVSKRNYAYLFDRVAGKDGRPQRYGTQGRCTAPETWTPNEIEDPENVDSRRAEVGLPPMEDYISVFKDICVNAN